MGRTRSGAGAPLRARDFRWLLAARWTSQLGDGFFQAYLVAELVFLDPERQGTALGVAKAFAILIIPFSLLGPFTGVLIDRWSRRRILVLTPSVRLLAALLLVVAGEGRPLLYGLALLVVSANRFFLTTAAAVLPSVVPPRDLLSANSVAAVGGTVITFLGLFAGTQLDPGRRGISILSVSAICWAAAPALATRLPPFPTPVRRQLPVLAEILRVVSELTSGLRRLVATPAATGGIISASLDQLLVGFVTVMGVVVFKEQLGEGLASYGRLLGAGGLGVLAGTLTVGRLDARMARANIVAVSFALAGVVCLATAAAPRGPALLAMSFAIGLTFAWRKICVDTTVQQTIPDRFRGRVFSIYDIAYSMARVAAAAAAIPLIPLLSTSWLLALTGLVYLAWAPVVPAWMRRPRSVRLLFHAGAVADEVPRTLLVGGEEEAVELVGSWSEERPGGRVRRLRIRTTGGELLDVVAPPTSGTWRVEREVPSADAPPP